jgi:hypothetical protein
MVQTLEIYLCSILIIVLLELNGGWSAWSTWSTCSVSCGDGFKTRSRSCTNPEPGINGKHCVGDNMQVVTCNKEDCRK